MKSQLTRYVDLRINPVTLGYPLWHTVPCEDSEQPRHFMHRSRMFCQRVSNFDSFFIYFIFS